jgi:hypothetical protein
MPPDERWPARVAVVIGRFARVNGGPTLAFVESIGGADSVQALIDDTRERATAKHRMLLTRADVTHEAVLSGLRSRVG